MSQSSPATQVTRLVLPDDEILAEFDELHLTGSPTAAFHPRQASQTPMIVRVGMVTGSLTASVQVDSGVELSILTQSSIRSDTASLNTTLFVATDGLLDLPEMVVIEKGTTLELCGGLAVRTKDIDVQQGAVFKAAYPAFSGARGDNSARGTLTLRSLAARGGGVATSSRCDGSGTLTLHLTYINKTSDFSLPSGITFSSGANQTLIEPTRSPLPNVTCIPEASLHLYKGQQCELPPGEHVFTDLTLESGATLILQGDSTGTQRTLIHANTLEVKAGATLTGVGTGHMNSGEGAATSGSMGGSYGGTGAGNPIGRYAVFGNMTAPSKYGGSGYQATESSGRGGGQLHLEVSVRARIDGLVDVSGNGGEGRKCWPSHVLDLLLLFLVLLLLFCCNLLTHVIQIQKNFIIHNKCIK